MARVGHVAESHKSAILLTSCNALIRLTEIRSAAAVGCDNNEKLELMAAAGELREINQVFKQARKVAPSLRNAD